MADKKTTGQQLSRRDPPRRDPEISGQQPETKAVVGLLTSILSEFQKQVQRNIPKQLEGKDLLEGKPLALEAVERFRQIVAVLALQSFRPRISLKADPTTLPAGGTTTLTWSSFDAETVTIDQNVGDVTPTAGGSKEVPVNATTTFKATAKGPCGSAEAAVTITVDGRHNTIRGEICSGPLQNSYQTAKKTWFSFTLGI